MNQVTLIGTLTKDVDLRKTQNNTSVVGFSLAINNVDKDGNKQTDFVDCVTWGKQAEYMAHYSQKGTLMLVQGKIRKRSYETNGEKKYVTEVVALRVENLRNWIGSKESKTVEVQPTLTGKDTFIAGDFDPNLRPSQIDPEELPFY